MNVKILSRILIHVFVVLINFSCSENKSSVDNNFRLQIRIDNMTSKEEWVLFKFEGKKFLPIDFSKNEINPRTLKRLKINNNTIIVEGRVNQKGFYRLQNIIGKEELNFLLDSGLHILRTDLKRMKPKDIYSFIPFEIQESKVNEEFLHFWYHPDLQKLLKELDDFNKWNTRYLQRLYSLTPDQYQIAKLRNDTLALRESFSGDIEILHYYQIEKTKLIDNIFALRTSAILNYINENPDNWVGMLYCYLYLHMFLPTDKSYEILKDHVHIIKRASSSNQFSKEMSIKFQLESQLQIGNVSPDFIAYNETQETIRLSDFRGNYVLVEFWNSQCDYCKDERLNLLNLYAKYSELDFEIFSVSFDTLRSLWENAKGQLGTPWFEVWDSVGFERSEIIVKIPNATIPYYYLVDKDGVVLKKNIRCPKYAKDQNTNINIVLDSLFGD